MSNQILYGFFSQKAFEHHDSIRFDGGPSNRGSLYSTPSGKQVIVTSVSTDQTNHSYKWEDKVCLGPDTKYISAIK